MQMLDHLMSKKNRTWHTPALNVTLHSDIMSKMSNWHAQRITRVHVGSMGVVQ